MNKYLISKLKEGRINKGLKQSDVTQFTGIKNTTLSNYENGITEPDIDTFLQLCELYELDYAGILAEAYGLSVQGEDFKIRPSEIEVSKKYRFISDYSPDGASMVDTVLDREYAIAEQLHEKEKLIRELEEKSIPVRIISYYQKLASAGKGEYLFDGVPTDLIQVVDTEIARDADFVIGVNGHSMEPTYYDGEKVFVKKMSEISTGEIGIFLKGNECYIKELGTDRLISHNMDKNAYPDIPASEEIVLVGKVLGKVEN